MNTNQSHRYANIWTLWVLSASMIPNLLMLLNGNLSATDSWINLLLPMCCYSLILALLRRTGIAVIAMFPVLFLSAFQIVLCYLYGSSVISIDMWLNLSTTNLSEVNELLSNLSISLLIVGLLYLPPIISGFVGLKKKWSISGILSGKLLRLSGVLFIVLVGVVAFGKPENIVNNVFPVNAIDNLAKAVERQSQVSHYGDTSASFRFDAFNETDTSKTVVNVIVIGETSRAANWSLIGYDRVTNPELSKVKGLMVFQKALTQSNTTHKSVPLLLSHIDAKHFGDSIYRVKSIITAFKEAGYSTVYLSSQQRNNSYIDFFGEEADKCLFLSDTTAKDYKPSDNDLLPYISTEIRNRGSHKKLIVVHTYGSHFNYLDRYGDKCRLFTPDNYAEANNKYRDKLINAFDNSIVETDNFLSTIIRILDEKEIESTLIYTSDHGEDIFDDDRNRFLHASPTPTYYQLHVPYLIWVSSEFSKNYQKKFDAALNNREQIISSSSTFFHTALDLADIQCPYLRKDLSVINPQYKPYSPLFLNDHNEAMALIDAGLTLQDRERFNEIGINLENDI